MQRFTEFAFFFVVTLLLQVFLFDNLNLGVYVHPQVYIAFILLLPMGTRADVTLGLGLLTGVVMDLMTGYAGLHTIATLAVAFLRPYLLSLFVGRDEVKEGGVPSPGRVGMGKFLRYAFSVVGLHCLIYFSFEALTTQYYYLTLLRVVLSTVVTVALVYFSQMLLPSTYASQSRK